MSRSRMGVGLEEPRGERSWLNKSWNSLQICLMDRRKGGNEGLPSVSNTTVAVFFFFSHPSSSFWISPHRNSSQETIEGTQHAGAKTSSMSIQKQAKHFSQHDSGKSAESKLVFNICPGCLFGFLFSVEIIIGLTLPEIKLSWKRVGTVSPQHIQCTIVLVRIYCKLLHKHKPDILTLTQYLKIQIQ